jgi:hypothetical protein
LSKENRLFPFRLAAIDLDDTLLSPDKSISARNIAAIRSLQSLGVRILLASGRRHENMRRYHRQLELDGPIVSCQGALAKDEDTGEILHRQCMPSNLAAEIVALGDRRGVTQVYYHMESTCVTQTNEWTELYGERTGTAVELIEDFGAFDGQEPLKVLWVGAPDAMQSYYEEMVQRYAGRLENVITDPEYLEFMALGVSKSLGIGAVAERYGIAQSEVLGFGDGNNDVTMLQWAGLGIAMDHGRPSALEAADVVAPAGIPEESFARGVELVIRNYA